jgi:hypothetical protein
LCKACGHPLKTLCNVSYIKCLNISGFYDDDYDDDMGFGNNMGGGGGGGRMGMGGGMGGGKYKIMSC